MTRSNQATITRRHNEVDATRTFWNEAIETLSKANGNPRERLMREAKATTGDAA